MSTDDPTRAELEKRSLYNFQQILPFNAGPIFHELAGKRVGDLTDEQAVQAHEDWIRAQFGHMQEYYRPHLSMLLHVIDKLRAERAKDLVSSDVQEFAKGLATAVAKDEEPEVGGFDLSAGLFGPNVSQWIRKIALNARFAGRERRNDGGELTPRLSEEP